MDRVVATTVPSVRQRPTIRTIRALARWAILDDCAARTSTSVPNRRRVATEPLVATRLDRTSVSVRRDTKDATARLIRMTAHRGRVRMVEHASTESETIPAYVSKDLMENTVRRTSTSVYPLRAKTVLSATSM